VSDPAAGWSARHHGIDATSNPVLHAWLRLMWTLARPLARLGVAPTALTFAGVAAAVVAVFVPPWWALALVAVAVLGDGLDGAVALFTSGGSRFGVVADAVADRVADCAFAAVIWRCGAPAWSAVLAGGLSLALESWRALGRGRRLTTITVAERPTRAICTGAACGAAGLSSAHWPATVSAGVWIGLGVVALVQLHAGRRR
jgi:phosphatidylglycerophosphate synthase